MRAEILSRVPRAGEHPELHFGEHFSSSLWVAFLDSNHRRWYGCFAAGRALGRNLVTTSGAGAFISAAGRGYIVNVEARTLVHQLEEAFEVGSVFATEDPDYFLVASAKEPFTWRVEAFDAQGRIGVLEEKLPVQAVQFEDQWGRCVYGWLNSFGGSELDVRFAVDLDTLTVERLEDVEEGSVLGVLSWLKKRPRSRDRRRCT